MADAAGSDEGDASEEDLESLRREVEAAYDFENFGPSDMAEMDAREWEAVFDPETWITGRDLLDRVENDLRDRIARREVFAVLEREPDRVIAYSDEGWGIVYPDGSVEGSGTVLRDLKPTVALCSMDSYEPEEPPEAYELPDPDEVEAGTGELGNRMLQVVAATQVLAGLGLIGVAAFTDTAIGGVANVVLPALGVFFLGIGLLLFLVVANARLSDRFRAEEYRDRLRAAGIEDADRPEFLPPPDAQTALADDATDETDGSDDTTDRAGEAADD